MNKVNDIYKLNSTSDEPWVELPDANSLANWGREEEIKYNQINRQSEKALFFRRTFDFLTDNRVLGDYYEFGCHRCRTFRMAVTEARKHNLAEAKFYAFDSFEGLPEPTSAPSVEIWTRGALTTSEADFMTMLIKQGHYIENIRTIKGFYDETLTKNLQKDKNYRLAQANFLGDIVLKMLVYPLISSLHCFDQKAKYE
jgi:hypothetical protein